MKRILLATLLLTPLALGAQNHQFVIKDTAAHVVDTYLRMLNFEALPDDSTLYLESTITSPGSPDTLVMHRWYAKPEMHRVEVRRNGTLISGLCTNGKDRYRKYIPRLGYWEDLASDKFQTEFLGYDFRAPLHQWRDNGITLAWNGTTLYKEQSLHVVKAIDPNRYDRYYMFDPSLNLLTLVIEELTVNGDSVDASPSHIDWKAFHEYQPIGESLVPSLESFMRDGNITIIATRPQLQPRNTLIFNRDQ